jgi:hypothetical protein
LPHTTRNSFLPALVLISLLTGAAAFDRFSRYGADSAAIAALDSLFAGGGREFIARRIDRGSAYIGGVFDTVHLSAERVAGLVQQYERYDSLFSLIKRARPACAASAETQCYYVEFGAWPVPIRVWTISPISAPVRTGARRTLFFSRHPDTTLYAPWAKRNKRRIRVRQLEAFAGYWVIESRGPALSRIAFVSLMDLGIEVPRWVIAFAWRIMLPGLLRDVRAYFATQQAE